MNINFWISGEYEFTPLLLLLPDPLWQSSSTCEGQIDLFENYWYKEYLKLYNFVWIISIRKEYLKPYNCVLINDYYFLIWYFYTKISWWFSTRVWVTTSHFKSPRLFLEFWLILTMLLFGWSPFVLLFPSPPVPVSTLWWLYQACQLHFHVP